MSTATETREERVARIVAQAPPLTETTRDRIAALFRAGAPHVNSIAKQ